MNNNLGSTRKKANKKEGPRVNAGGPILPKPVTSLPWAAQDRRFILQ